MILDLPTLLATVLPDAGRDIPITVMRVHTTRPLYLVFGADPRTPRWVIQVGPQHEVERVHLTLARLHACEPDLVPDSVACQPIGGGDWVHVQTGVGGVPWFRLQRQIQTPDAWDGVAARSSQILARLHDAIRAQADWHRALRPARELEREREIAIARGVSLSTPALRCVEDSRAALEDLGSADWFWQHGDFCLNNLLLDADSAGIIDFEEFGETAMPLHDELGLALSLHDLTPEPIRRRSWTDTVRACVAPTLTRHPWLAPHVSGLLVHHLLWRINRCHGRAGRTSVRQHLIERLDRFAAEPVAL